MTVSLSARITNLGALKLIIFFLVGTALFIIIHQVSGNCWIYRSTIGSFEPQDLISKSCYMLWFVTDVGFAAWSFIALLTAFYIRNDTKSLLCAKTVIIFSSVFALTCQGYIWWNVHFMQIS